MERKKASELRGQEKKEGKSIEVENKYKVDEDKEKEPINADLQKDK